MIEDFDALIEQERQEWERIEWESDRIYRRMKLAAGCILLPSCTWNPSTEADRYPGIILREPIATNPTRVHMTTFGKFPQAEGYYSSTAGAKRTLARFMAVAGYAAGED